MLMMTVAKYEASPKKHEEILANCLLFAGNVYRSGKDISVQRGGISISGVSVAKDPFPRWQHKMYLPLEERVSKQMQTSNNKGEHRSLVSQQSSQCNFKLKASGRSRCSFLCSAPYGTNNVGHGEVYRLGLSKRKHAQTEVGKTNKFRVCYKSEEYDISETKMDPLQSTEGTGEAILLEGRASPWWQQFPKRWVIVLLCFTAFLLCNMDRVSHVFLVFMLSIMM